jgi:hypothetical protein
MNLGDPTHPIDMPGNGPTPREWGHTLREVSETRHSVKNQSMKLEELEYRFNNLNLRMEKLKTQLWTSVSIVAALITLGGWILDRIIGWNK